MPIPSRCIESMIKSNSYKFVGDEEGGSLKRSIVYLEIWKLINSRSITRSITGSIHP